MSSRLVDYQRVREFEEENAHEMLHPLVEGHAVVLRVSDPRMAKKSRVKQPLMFINPSQNFRLGEGSLVVSITGYGCEVVPVDDIRPLHLYRAGLSMQASKMLASELKKLFKQ